MMGRYVRQTVLGYKPHYGVENGRYKHGGKGERLYEVWYSMRARCNKPTDKFYHRYGGRGITVCDEWNQDYAKFRRWALANGYREGLSIDRKNNNGNYEPSNCRWATPKEQGKNRPTTILLTYRGETKSIREWAEQIGISNDTLYFRYAIYGWSIERALTERVSLDKYHRTKQAKGFLTREAAEKALGGRHEG